MTTREKIIAARAANPTIKAAAIAVLLGVSRERVRQVLKSEGMRTRMARATPAAAKKRPEYLCWWNMLSRCYNPKNSAFRYYGARGIIVCARWRTSFENFIADMGKRPSDGHSIDRRNNDGNYEPRNCRWATRSEQQSNKRPGATQPIDNRMPVEEARKLWRAKHHRNWQEALAAVNADTNYHGYSKSAAYTLLGPRDVKPGRKRK